MAHASKKVRQRRRLKRTTSLAKKQTRSMFTELFHTRAILAAIVNDGDRYVVSKAQVDAAVQHLTAQTGRLTFTKLANDELRVEFVIHEAKTKAFEITKIADDEPIVPPGDVCGGQ